MNILHEEFFYEKFLQHVPYAVPLWFIMAIIRTLNRVLEKPILVDILLSEVAERIDFS
jgi:hypothetical protein